MNSQGCGCCNGGACNCGSSCSCKGCGQEKVEEKKSCCSGGSCQRK